MPTGASVSRREDSNPEVEMFMARRRFDLMNVAHVPRASGVYVIYRAGTPVYIGRSRVDIHRRLNSHVTGRGNRGIADAVRRGTTLEFEWQELGSPEQAEAILIRELGGTTYFNMRRETDPADWD
jgi:hypothetical protein